MNKKTVPPRAIGGFQDNPQNINRKGRPKGISITEMVKTALEEVEPKTGKPWKDLIVKRILVKAVNDGDQQMIKAIWQYIDGMPQQNTDITSKGEKINISFHESLKREIETDSNQSED